MYCLCLFEINKGWSKNRETKTNWTESGQSLAIWAQLMQMKFFRFWEYWNLFGTSWFSLNERKTKKPKNPKTPKNCQFPAPPISNLPFLERFLIFKACQSGDLEYVHKACNSKIFVQIPYAWNLVVRDWATLSMHKLDLVWLTFRWTHL